MKKKCSDNKPANRRQCGTLEHCKTETATEQPVFKELCYHAELVSQVTSWTGYTTYVFKNLDPSASPLMNYVMCTRFPNWDHRLISTGERGYLSVRYVFGGRDSWFDGDNFVPYKNNGVHFLAFLPEETDDQSPQLETELLD